MEVIAGHPNTDFDAFASMLACRRLYPHAVVVLTGSLNRNVREFARLHADELDLVDAARIDPARVTRLVLVELRDPAKLGELASALRPGVEVALFDHHSEPLPEWLPPETAVVSGDGALTTTLCGILAEREIAVSALEATAFALGIHEDTGSLTYVTTTQRDIDALSWCFRHGARQELVNDYLHAPLAPTERRLLQHLLEALEPIEPLADDVLLAAISWPEYVDGVSNLAHKIVELTDARALVLLVEMDERVFVVVRSRTGRIDAAAIAAALGGGGHSQAASAISRETLPGARELVIAAVRATRRSEPLARDVMSTPARAVAPTASVRDAMTLCQRHGQSGVFVAEEGRLVGGVSREDLDKAIGHDLAHAPVRGIMSSQVVSAHEEASLAELRTLVTAAEDGRVAVLRADELVGVVSRADLLRTLEGAPAQPSEVVESIGDELRSSPRLRHIADAVARLSERADSVYLVGGTIRDLLLGEESFDVDIAVEGDAIAFAYALARELGGRATPHQRFGTAIVSPCCSIATRANVRHFLLSSRSGPWLCRSFRQIRPKDCGKSAPIRIRA
jgi:tRNA nucleotidyltransferase (CCA-adding enzyme)